MEKQVVIQGISLIGENWRCGILQIDRIVNFLKFGYVSICVNQHTCLNDDTKNCELLISAPLLLLSGPLTLERKVPWSTIASIGISYGHSRFNLCLNSIEM